jgi:hypothetical protein
MTISLHTQIPFGNACDSAIDLSGELAEVSFAADPHGAPERLWFCFRLENAGVPRRLRLALKHFESMLGADDSGASFRPVIRHPGRDWERLGPGRLERLPDGRKRLLWDLELGAQADVAACYPYGQDELDALVRDGKGFWRLDSIGVSQGGRPLLRLSNAPGEVGGKRPGLYLVARQHSGETPGSWVLDGCLRHLAGLGKGAPLVWALPLANADGVAQGDYGKDNFPWDLNRAWASPPMRHEVLCYQGDLLRWRERCQAAFVADFHAPGLAESDGLYCYLPPWHESWHRAQAEAWSGPIGRSLGPDFAAEEFGRVANYPSRFNTEGLLQTWSRKELGVAAATFETPYSMLRGRVLERGDFQEMGRRIALGILEKLPR